MAREQAGHGIACWRQQVTPAFLLAWVVIAVVTLVLFGSVLVGATELAFRDVWHFYRPLYGWLGQAGGWPGPLWGEYDQTGVSVAGEATSAYFYFPRVILFSALPVGMAMGCYVVLHLLLAGGGAFWLARGEGASAPASYLAAWAYAASGCVFFLYSNPPFLVGAGWLPWAVGALVQVLRQSSGAAWVCGGVSLAMCVLGGDPQAAVHAVLVAIGWRVFGGDRGQPVSETDGGTWASRWSGMVWRLGCVLVFTMLLSAPQVVAGWQWARQSWRAETSPHSLWSLAGEWGRGEWGRGKSGRGKSGRGGGVAAAHASGSERGWSRQPWARGRAGTHAAKVYDFSVPPWHVMELVLPTASGRLAGGNERWLGGMPGESRVWAPTMYCGLAASLLWLTGWTSRQRRNVWWWVATLGLVLAWGRFGGVYLVRTVAHWCGVDGDWAVADAAGGAYWWLVTLVPGYGSFRYPAKWLTVFALGMATYAATRLGSIGEQPQDARWIKRLCGCSIGLAVVVWASSWAPGWNAWLEAVRQSGRAGDRFWGPLDIHASLLAVRGACVHCVCVALALRFTLASGAWAARGWGVITVVELAVIASWQLHVVEVNGVRGEEGVVGVEVDGGGSFPERALIVDGGGGWPERWRQQLAEPGRLSEVMGAQRNTEFGRWYLTRGVNVVNQSVSLNPAPYAAFWMAQRERERELRDECGSDTSRLERELLRFREVVARFLRADELHDRVSRPGERGVRLWSRPVSSPRSWFRFDAMIASVKVPQDAQQMLRQMRVLIGEIERSGGDCEPTVWIREGDELGSETWAEMVRGRADESLRETGVVSIQRHDRGVTVVRVEAATAGLLSLMRLADAGWRVERRSGPQESWQRLRVYQVDGLGQGVWLPAGVSEVRLVYSPWWWWPMVCTALCVWLGVIGWWGRASLLRVRSG